MKRRPFVQFWPSIAWSTLELTINADGTSSRGLAGASPFPRHWVYDENGALIEKSAVIDFKVVGGPLLRRWHAVGLVRLASG